MSRHVAVPRAVLCVLGLMLASPLSFAQGQSQAAHNEAAAGGLRYIEAGMPPVMIHPTVDAAKQAREAARPVKQASTSKDLSYHGGVGGIGVETTARVYLVLWGSQWNNNDPSGESAILQNFYSGAGGSKWLNSVTQYCQGVASGTFYCNGAGQAAGNPPSILAGVWADSASTAPSKPRQSQLAAEAVKAAQHFGNTTCVEKCERAVCDRDINRAQCEWFRLAILCLAQLDKLDGRQRGLHKSALYDRRGCKLRRKFQRLGRQGRYHDRRRSRDGRDHHRPVPEWRMA